jgi:hypothetical protein
MRAEHYSRLRDLVGGMVYGPPKPLPAQFTGKRQLLEALLLDAIRTFHLLVHARKPGERQRFEEVEAWVTSADTEYVFSFINVCTFLGLNAEAVRAHLSAWKASQNGASAQVPSVPKSQCRIVQR